MLTYQAVWARASAVCSNNCAYFACSVCAENYGPVLFSHALEIGLGCCLPRLEGTNQIINNNK